jgi:hypothetical protein
MIMYSFSQGREVLLLTEDGATQRYALKRDVSPVSSHIVCDPQSLRDASFGLNRNDPFENQAVELANQGFTVFEMPGRITNQRYAFAVKVGEFDSEMD